MSTSIATIAAPSQALGSAGNINRWIVFEGGDGVGKSTQIDLLVERLRSEGIEHTLTREPGGTELGTVLRQAIMHGDHVDPRAEALLYAADRAQHISHVVRPSLDAGVVVVQDRYIDSSVVYQGLFRGLGDGLVEEISMWAAGGILPGLTVVLDGAAQVQNEQMDRVERESASHADRIRSGFRERAALDPGRYAVIDAARPIDVVAEAVWAAVSAFLTKKSAARLSLF